MLYLFCSAASPLYKRDALESISYPVNHIFRFRYALKYVDKGVVANLEKFTGKPAVLIFLDTIGSPASPDFDFYPLRLVTILGLEDSAGAIYCNFRFGDFVHYGDGSRRKDLWNSFFRKLPGRPWPPGRPADGHFVFETTEEPPELIAESSRPYDNWNSVVNCLDKTKDLKDSTFLLVLGFYRVRRRGFRSGFREFWKMSEQQLEPTDNQFDSIYPVPMGESVVLKILLSRPSFNYSDPKSARVLKISAGSDTFSGMSKEKIISESRYNEDRTVLVCKRVFDAALAAVSIEEKDVDVVRSPRLTLLTRVRVPRLVISSVVGGVAVGALLLAFDADVVRFIASIGPKPFSAWLDGNAKPIAAIAKLLSPLPLAISAYVAFRRLPVK